MSRDVQTLGFEGPFDLLLHLITKDKVDIYNVSLANIVDEYVREVEKLAELDLEAATEFLLIASILIELKSRRLLPEPASVDIDEEVAFWEERDYLLSRLLECKTFKDAASAFAEMIQRSELSLPRRAGMEESFASMAPDPLEGLDPRRLRAAFIRVTTPKAVPTVDLFHVNPIRISVADTVQLLGRRIASQQRAWTFSELVGSIEDRIEIAVHFIALLELYKQGLIDLQQAGNFQDIFAEWMPPSDADVELALVGTGDGYEG